MVTDATPPTPSDLSSRLWVTAMRITRGFRLVDGTFTPTQLSVAATILRRGPIALNELAAQERLSPAMITRVVQTLERDGLVCKHQPSSDRRLTLAEVTPLGHQRITAALDQHWAALAGRLLALDEAERSQLADALPLLERLADLHASSPAADLR